MKKLLNVMIDELETYPADKPMTWGGLYHFLYRIRDRLSTD